MLGPGSTRAPVATGAGSAGHAARLRDAEVARRIAARDRDALAEAARTHFARVFAVARRIMGNDAEAEDVAQDVFLKLWNAPPDLEASGAGLSTWLYRVATNRCFDMLRRMRPDQLDETVERAGDDPGPEDDAGRAQVARTVDAALAALPARQRAALVLTYYEGFTNREAADMLDTGVEAIESLLARARRTLKAELEGSWRELLEALDMPHVAQPTTRRDEG